MRREERLGLRLRGLSRPAFHDVTDDANRVRSLALHGHVIEEQWTLAELETDRRVRARGALELDNRFLGDRCDRAGEQSAIASRRRRERCGAEVVVGEVKLEWQQAAAFLFWHSESSRAGVPDARAQSTRSAPG